MSHSSCVGVDLYLIDLFKATERMTKMFPINAINTIRTTQIILETELEIRKTYYGIFKMETK